MTINGMTRSILRDSRKCILMALIKYARQACKTIGVKYDNKSIRIIKSARSTNVRLPKKLIPDDFIQMIFEANETKKYHFEFCQKDPDYIHIILNKKPLVIEGQGILFYFFRELLQYLEKGKKK